MMARPASEPRVSGLVAPGPERHRVAVTRDMTHELSFNPEQRDVGQLAQPSSVLNNRIKDRPEVIGRTADDSEDFAGRGLLLARFNQLACEGADLLLRVGGGAAGRNLGLGMPKFYCLVGSLLNGIATASCAPCHWSAPGGLGQLM